MPSVESRLARLERQELPEGRLEAWLDRGDGRFAGPDGQVLTREELDARPSPPGVKVLRVVIVRREDGR